LFYWVTKGDLGVDLFFVISGFLIGGIIFKEIKTSDSFNFKRFYTRRFLRLTPVYIAAIFMNLFFLKSLGQDNLLAYWPNILYINNYVSTAPMGWTWSLAIEEQFYIIWPLIIWYAWKRKFNLLTITIVVAIASFVLNIKGIKHDMVATFYSPQTRFWELLSGSLLAWVTLYKKDALANVMLKLDYWLSRIVYSEKQEADGKVISKVLSFVGLLLLVYGFWRINKELSFPGKWALVPVLGTILVIMAGPKAWFNRVILSNRIAVWFGLISFPLYLWHWPIIVLFRSLSFQLNNYNWHLINLIIIFITFLISVFSYHFIENKTRNSPHTLKLVGILILFAFKKIIVIL
jgi:peptidoglycan/LPS O-acetylase OafA/YrhL